MDATVGLEVTGICSNEVNQFDFPNLIQVVVPTFYASIHFISMVACGKWQTQDWIVQLKRDEQNNKEQSLVSSDIRGQLRAHLNNFGNVCPGT